MLDSSRKRYRSFKSDKTGTTAGDAGTSGDTSVGRKSRKHYLRGYIRWLWPYRWRIFGVLGLALISAGLAMVLPLVTRYIIDDVLGDSSHTAAERMGRLWTVCGAMLLLLVASQGLDTFRSYLMAVLNAKVIFRLRRKLFERFLRLPLNELHDLKSGGIVSRLSQDTDKVKGMVQMAVITPGAAIIRVILTIVALVFISWQMALLASAMIPPIVLINLMWIRKVRPIYRAMADSRSEIDGRVTETFSGIRVVRAFRRERKEERDYAIAHHTVIRQDLLAQKLQLVVTGGWGLLIPATSLAVVGFGGYLVLEGRGTIGDIVAFQMFAFMLLMPVSQIVNSLNATQQALAAMERVFEIMERQPEKPDAPGARDVDAAIKELRFDSVGFEYVENIPVLSDISLTVPAGSMVALVGPSGGGKTTFVDLVARFYDPTRGAVLINGVDLRNFKLESYRHRLAIVTQEVFLFDGSVAENIAYGCRDATMEGIDDAARRANAYEFIHSLPEGFDTLIGERGIKLSGGQRQRLSIARAVLADPEILILDEATSNLDTESEQLIQASVQQLVATRTTFVIAHRLSTITHADIIVVLRQGQLEQVGSHTDLMATAGLYREMIDRQQNLFTEPTAAVDWE